MTAAELAKALTEFMNEPIRGFPSRASLLHPQTVHEIWGVVGQLHGIARQEESHE